MSTRFSTRPLLLLLAGLPLAALPATGDLPQAPQETAGLPPRAPVPAPRNHGPLSFATRMQAQSRIERVYYNHRIWPKENPGPKPPFEQLAPAAVVEKKATEALRMGAALKKLWQVEITPAMLQAELERMERDSKDRAMLHELFAALGNDPFVIAETLARGNLTERAIHRQYAYDAGLHADARRRAEAVAAHVNGGAEWSRLDGDYSRHRVRLDDPAARRGKPAARDQIVEVHVSSAALAALRKRLAGGKSGPMREEETGWLMERQLSDDADGLTVESLFIPKRSFEDWWAETAKQLTAAAIPATASGEAYRMPEPGLASICDEWQGGLKDPSPGVRVYHSAIWTGSEMILWGGYNGVGSLNTRERYNPATDSWLPTATGSNAPDARSDHSAVWTGTEMIIWGGVGAASVLDSGGRYNPATDSWLSTATGANLPAARAYHTAVWTGSEMIVWGGYGGSMPGGTLLNSGGRYRPDTDSWNVVSQGADAPAARGYPGAVWTGSEMIVWGGETAVGGVNSGGRYNPSTDLWLPTSTGANVPAAREHHTTVWTGSEMIVWGGYTNVGNSGGRYNPATDSWLPTAIDANTPEGRADHTAVWTGAEMIVWGGANNPAPFSNGGRYNPATDSWQPTSNGANLPAERSFHTAVWTGTEMIVWGGYFGNRIIGTGGRYNPATDSWQPTSNGAYFPRERQDHTAVWTGSEMIVWGGNDGTYLNTGGRYDPATDTWRQTSTGADVPLGRVNHTAIWTGTEMILWGGFSGNFPVSQLNTGGRYNPVTDDWLPTSTGPDTPEVRSSHTAVWTGSEMIVWGGVGGADLSLNTGGRYSPENDSWIPVTTGGNVPAGRASHTAVWSGGEMIVWGGADFNGGSAALNSGGRYNPATGGWLPTSTGDNVPSPRTAHTAVWTGVEMIVWGGVDGATYWMVNTGGRYNPATDQWTPTSTGPNVPEIRTNHSAAWTGSEMIIWGGLDNVNTVLTDLNNGGRYNPVSDSWLATSTAASVPEGRESHTAVWTGGEMIVWGGWDQSLGWLNSTGIYTSGSVAGAGNSLHGGKSAGGVRLSWAPVYGAGSYRVQRCDTSYGTCIPTAVVSSPTIPQYGEADDGNSYFYAVEAANQCGATP